MGMIVIRLGTRWSADDKPGSAGHKLCSASLKPGST